MLTSSSGVLTIVDINNSSPAYYWLGEKLAYVISCLAINSGRQRRVSIRVQDPAKVMPALDAAERSRLNSVYTNMQSAGIVVLIGRGE